MTTPPATTTPARPAAVAPSTRIEALRELPLERWLEHGDPLAEAAVAALRAHDVPPSETLLGLRRLAAEGDDTCRDFLHDVETPAEWADFDAMAVGGAMGYRHFPQLVFATLHGGLMTTFCSADAAHILARTRRLERDPVRRIFESAPLFFSVLDAEELRPGGKAWEICVHVRLMHAMVRVHLERTDAWPRLGRPINALHTATGPLFFSAMVLERIRSLGGSITAQEADGYGLIWRYVTHLLGVPRDLLGDTQAEQDVLDARILPLGFDPDENSRALASILLGGLTQMPGTRGVPRSAHEVIVRHMLGDARADAMGIPPRPRGVRIIRALGVALRPYGWAQRLPLVAGVLERLGRTGAGLLIARGRPAAGAR